MDKKKNDEALGNIFLAVLVVLIIFVFGGSALRATSSAAKSVKNGVLNKAASVSLELESRKDSLRRLHE